MQLFSCPQELNTVQCFQQNRHTAAGFFLCFGKKPFPVFVFFPFFPSNGSRPYSHFRSTRPGQCPEAFTTDLRKRPWEQQLVWQDAQSYTRSLRLQHRQKQRAPRRQQLCMWCAGVGRHTRNTSRDNAINPQTKASAGASLTFTLMFWSIKKVSIIHLTCMDLRHVRNCITALCSYTSSIKAGAHDPKIKPASSLLPEQQCYKSHYKKNIQFLVNVQMFVKLFI